MPCLRELQGLFWQSTTSTPGELGLTAALLDVTEASATLGAAGRLQVYADAYFSRLREVLAEDFPRVAEILGPDRFSDLTSEYLTAHPSEHPSVRHLGRHLPALMTGRADLPPFLADLAHLEWARREVFDAADCAAISTNALQTVEPENWPELRFATIPALVILKLAWPVHEIWEHTDVAPIAPNPTFIRVWRSADYRVYHAPMSARDVRALDRLIAGEPFGAICGVFADLPSFEGARQATGLLARWLEDGIIGRLI